MRSRPAKALFASVALHGLLLAAWPDPRSVDGSRAMPSMLRVAIVGAGDSDAVESAPRATESAPTETAPAEVAPAETAPAETAPARHVRVAHPRAEERPSPAPAFSTRAPAGDDTAPENPSPTPTPTLAADDTASAETRLAARNALEPLNEPAPREASAPSAQPDAVLSASRSDTSAASRTEPAPRARERAATADAAATSAETVEPRVTTPIDEHVRDVLERRVASWAESFAALGGSQPPTTWTEKDVDYAATVAHLPAADAMGIEEAIVTVTTELDGRRWSTELRMRRLAFSHFAQLIDRWDPEVQIHDDEIDGRFHSNTEIFVAKSGAVQPTFHGKVTTARGINTSRSSRRVRRSEVFLGGLQTRAPRIVLPRGALPFPDGAESDDEIDEERIHEIDAETRIVFYPDGSYGWRDAEGAGPEQRRRLTRKPHYLIAGEDAELRLSGVVNGQVLVYSPERLVIEGDLVYADDPSTVPGSDDFLGLVSERNVEIAGPDVTGHGDLSVHAAIYAKRRFVVQRYLARDDATLEVFGSVTAGSLTATEPRFRTRLRFDPRLEHRRPPGFPVTDRYEIVDWDGLWTARTP